MVPYARPVIALQVCLHPTHVLAAAIAPLGEELTPTFEPIPRATAYPKKDKRRVRRERREREVL